MEVLFHLIMTNYTITYCPTCPRIFETSFETEATGNIWEMIGFGCVFLLGLFVNKMYLELIYNQKYEAT